MRRSKPPQLAKICTMNDNLKTSNNVLLDNLISVFEIPERLNKLDVVRLKELLLFIKDQKNSRLDFINKLLFNDNYNYPASYQPNKHFEYWAETFTQYGMNYYDLIRIENLIIEKLNNNTKNKETTLLNLENNYCTKYRKYFTPYGYELFEYINNHFFENKTPTKYSEIYHFMIGRSYGKINCYKTTFQEFLKLKYSITFAKILDSTNKPEIKEQLTGLQKDFIKKSNAPIKTD